MTVQTGNLFNLYCRFNGNDNITPEQYRLIGQFAQKSGFESNYDCKTKELSIELDDLFKVACENFDTNLLKYLYKKDSTCVDSKLIFEWLYYNNRNLATISMPATTDENGYKYLYDIDIEKKILNNFWMVKLTDFETYLETLITQIYHKFTRFTTDPAFTVTLPFPTFYKQLNDGHGSKGTALSYSDLYLIGYISENKFSDRDIATFLGGFLSSSGDKSELANDYPYIYNFLFDLYEEGMQKICYDYYSNSMTNANVISITGNTITNVNFDIDSDNPKLQPEVLKTATASYTEYQNSDASKNEANNPSSLSGNTFDIPIIFTNLPASWSEYKFIKYNDGTWVTSPYIYLAANWKFTVHLRGLYYKETASYDGHTLTTSDQFFRVHEYCKYETGSTNGSEDYIDSTDTNYDVITEREGSLAESPPDNIDIKQIGAVAGKGKILAATMIGLYGQNTQAGMSGTVPLYEGTLLTSATSNLGCPYFDLFTNIEYDMSSLAPTKNSTWFSAYPTIWDIIKCEVDVLKGTAKIDMQTIPIAGS